jgi:ubiquinone/menaquinone biosynthesis C-methylase UbiE
MPFKSQRIMEPEVMETLEEVYAYDRLSLKYLSILHNGFIETVINASPEKGRFLEVGCGTGRVTIGVAKYTEQIRIVGIDLSDSMLAVAKDNATTEGVNHRVQFRYADGKELPFEDNAFDAVFSHNMLHHLHDPIPVILEMARVVKEDGAFLIRDLVRKSRFMARLHANFFGLTYTALMKKEYFDSMIAAFSKQEFESFIALSGIEGLTYTQQFITHHGIEKPSIRKRETPVSIPDSFTKSILKNLYVSRYQVDVK